MKDYKFIPKVILLALLIIGVILSVMFYAGGSEGTLEVAGDFLDIPLFTNLFLVWNYILLCLVICITLGVVVWEFIKLYKVDKKKALRGLCVVIGFVGLILLCWFLGSPAEVKIIGYEGADNVGTMERLSDACLYLTYILTCATLVALVWVVIHTKRMK